MGLFRENGQRITKNNIATTDADDPLVEITEDVYERRSYGHNDPHPDGTIHTQKWKAGKVLRQSEVDALFQGARVASIQPAQGPAAGGTKVTVKGERLDGVSAVKFDGANGTGLKIAGDYELSVTAPAGAAGPADVVLVNDGDDATAPAGFTYT